MPDIRNKRHVTIVMVSATLLLLMGVVGCNKTQSTQALVAEAREFQQKGDNNAAVIQLKNALQKSPDDPEARYLLGTIYYEMGDPKSAENQLRRALSLGMSADKVLPPLGKSLLVQGEFQKILDEIKPVSGAKESAEISSLRGDAYQGLGKEQDAKESYERALEHTANFPDALIGLAKNSLAKKDNDSATRYAEQAVSQNPQNPDVWQFKGDLLRVQGKNDLALAAYDQVLKVQPKNSFAHISKASLEIATGKFDEAKLDIEAARKVTPNNPNVTYIQALLDFHQGKSAAALEGVQHLLSLAPEHQPSILLAGALQYSLGSMAQAEQYLKTYLKKDPDNRYARKLLASSLLKSHQTQFGIDVLSPALKSEQQDPQLFAIAGALYMQAGDYTQAEAYFSKASALAPKKAELRSALGLSKLALGENDRALAEMEAAVNLDAQSPNASIMLVLTHLRLNKFDKALAAAKSIVKKQPDDPLGYNLQGVAYLGRNDAAAARASFEKALSIQPANFTTVGYLVQLDLQEKKPEAAKKRLETFLEKDKKNIQAMTTLAGVAQSQGKTTEVTAWLERARNENPDALQPAIALANHYLRTNEKQKALTIAQKLHGSNPDNPDAVDILAQAQFANGDKTAALETYTKFSAKNPDSARVQLRIANLYMAMQNPSAASDALKKSLTLQPDFADAQLALASLELRKENYAGAISIARQMQKKSGTSPIGYALEGDVMMAQKKPALAVKAYEQAFALAKSGQLVIKLHGSLTEAGRSKDASVRLTEWVKEHPLDVPTHLYLAGTYLAAKQKKAAIEEFQTILRQDPKNAIVLNDLAWTYQQENDPRALEYAQQANQLSPDNPAILDTLGWILLEQGNFSQGLPLLQKANSLVPDDPVIHYHFVLALAKSGDKAKARKELEHLLATGRDFAQIGEARSLLKQL